MTTAVTCALPAPPVPVPVTAAVTSLDPAEPRVRPAGQERLGANAARR